MQIRCATVGDAAAIARVHVRSWATAYQQLPPEAFLDGLDSADWEGRWHGYLAGTQWPRQGTFVAHAGSSVVGFISLCPDGDAEPAYAGLIASIYLLPDHWREGIGGRLMVAGLSSLRAAGYLQAHLWVLEGNRRAIAFYEAAGWRADSVSRSDQLGGIPVTEHRYSRELRPKVL